jgi:peptidyl-prolyl cis-trans isomerase D
MPFEVFRRHQRKLLAIFAILAMFGFVVSDSLPRLLSSSYAGRDQKVAELYGKTVYQSQLNELARQRARANQFISGISQFMPREVFGGLRQRDLVDALILQREADRLQIPANPEMAREWLKQITGGRMNAQMFGTLFSRFSNEVSEEQLLSDIANQLRLASVRRLMGSPVVTPFDVYRAYRDQNERIGAKAVEIPVDTFLSKVPEPSPADVQALFDKYKDVLPDPASETPGFKVPRRVQLEILSLDGNALARGLQDKLTEAELRSYYENHKQEYEVPLGLPEDLFAEQPELTPPNVQPFEEVRALLAPRLAEERALSEIQDRFARVKDTEMIPFADKYLGVLDEQDDAKKQGGTGGSTPPLPLPTDLQPVAEREGLNYEKTGLLTREEAARHGTIATAEVGLTPLSGGKKFAEEVFDAKTNLFEPIELTDAIGTRFLIRKTKDEPPHVPALDEVRSDVILAWKLAQARPLAEKAAREIAEQIKSKGGTIKEPKVDSYSVRTIPPVSRTQQSFQPASMFEPSPVTETPIPEVSHPGEAFRDTYFGLRKGEVEVAVNQPKTVYYVLTEDRREPATFAALYSPNSDEFRYKAMARETAARRQDAQWMGWLRQQAGLKADWLPPDEANKEKEKEEASKS